MVSARFDTSLYPELEYGCEKLISSARLGVMERPDAMISISKECQETPDVVRSAPTRPFRGRLDEARAAKELKLRE